MWNITLHCKARLKDYTLAIDNLIKTVQFLESKIDNWNSSEVILAHRLTSKIQSTRVDGARIDGEYFTIVINPSRRNIVTLSVRRHSQLIQKSQNNIQIIEF